MRGGTGLKRKWGEGRRVEGRVGERRKVYKGRNAKDLAIYQ